MVRWWYLTSIVEQPSARVPTFSKTSSSVVTQPVANAMRSYSASPLAYRTCSTSFTSGDGLWYWYAVLFDKGQRLYADLHLNLQPLFIVATWASLHIFGHSWLAFRVFPALPGRLVQRRPHAGCAVRAMD